MMKKQLLLTALLALLNSASLSAQILFEQRHGINNDDHEFAGGGALAPDGGLVLCGSTEQDKTHHLFVQKLDSSGVEVWYKLYTQLGAGNLFGIIAAAGGGYFVSSTKWALMNNGRGHSQRIISLRDRPFHPYTI